MAGSATGRATALLAAISAVCISVIGASAAACTNLATISLSRDAGHPGDNITLTGTSFPVRRNDPRPTPVEIRWGSLDGEILATVTPERTGSISASFTVPRGEPGAVVIVASQRRPIVDPATPDAPPTAFQDEYGTPARATFRILGVGEVAGSFSTPDNQVAAGADDGTSLLVVMALLGAVALSLFGGGVIAFLHQVRSRAMVAQPWRVP